MVAKKRRFSDDVEELIGLEKLLMDPDFRQESAEVAALLAMGFMEYGASGREWTAREILTHLVQEPPQPAPRLENMVVRGLAEDAALVTYRAIREDRITLRSSVWVSERGQWRIVFHQGTSVPPRPHP
jgi:ribonuclease HI